MVTRATQLGWRGEEAVRRWLERRDFVFVKRNFRTRYGEIDLIMRDGDTLAFIEVKTRSNRRFGIPEESVGEHKLERLGMAVAAYCQRNPEISDYRLDLAVVEWRGSWQVRYTQDVFR